MNELKLSKRLQSVANKISPYNSIADIGSDHAYLPCYAMLNKDISFGIAGEVNEGPFQSAVHQVKKCNLQERIVVRKGDGLSVISPGEVEVVTIAGMGGQLIQTILEQGSNKLEGVKRLILQPNVGSIFIRKWLVDNGWELISEEILEEDSKIYEVIVAEKGVSHKPYSQNIDAELLLGPFLMKERNETFVKKWSHELEKWRKIVKQMEEASNVENAIKNKEKLLRKISAVEEALKWQRD